MTDQPPVDLDAIRARLERAKRDYDAADGNVSAIDLFTALRDSDLLLAEVSRLTRALGHWKKLGARAEAAEKALEEAQRERDLAIAHDRQPYPTAHAYEQVCKAREKWQRRAEAAEQQLAALQSREEPQP